jgi:hypothetical protein
MHLEMGIFTEFRDLDQTAAEPKPLKCFSVFGASSFLFCQTDRMSALMSSREAPLRSGCRRSIPSFA